MPIGVPQYQLTKAPPEEIASQLPTVEQLENELGDAGDDE
jgi:hypothetical protein